LNNSKYRFARQAAIEYDRKLISPSDYTLKITGLPEG